MGYEVDFLGVGEESKSGDAIAIRFGNLHGCREEQTVVVIDGGYTAIGAKLVEHIKTQFNTDVVDLVISSHPDQDHINGLDTVVNELRVKELWIHQPWEHNTNLASKFSDGRVTDNSLGERLKENLERAYALVKTARANGIRVREPFTGLTDLSGAVTVLGPSIPYYEELLADFEGMPARADQSSLSFAFEGLLKQFSQNVKRFFANWGDDHISDDGQTSPRNNSSVVTQIIVEKHRLLFTADAGIQALEHAADQIDLCLKDAELRFIQIPHHGSRRNIGPSVLNRLVGPPVAPGISRSVTAIASTATKGEPKHPRKTVMNAFTHRGVYARATRGSGLCHSFNAPARPGWGSLEAEPYHYDFEEEL